MNVTVTRSEGYAFQLTPIGDHAYTATSASVLYFFEICITLSREVSVIWNRKFIKSTWLYIFIRYATLSLNIAFFAASVNLKSCQVTLRFVQTLDYLQHISYASFARLRFSALIGTRVSYLPFVVYVLNILPLISTVFTYGASSAVWEKETQACFLAIPTGFQTVFFRCVNIPVELYVLQRLVFGCSVSVISCSITMITDFLVCYVIWRKCFNLHMQSRMLFYRNHLVTELLHDSVTDIFIFVVVNVLELLITLNIPALSFLDWLTPYLRIIPPITTCRFIIKIRLTAQQEESLPSDG